jgi:hypothetical protein
MRSPDGTMFPKAMSMSVGNGTSETIVGADVDLARFAVLLIA